MSGAVEHLEPRLIDGLAVTCFGDPAQPAVLLSGGLGGAGAYWMPQVEALGKDHFVVLYDHRGTGGSDRSPLPAGYSTQHMADDMLCVLDGLGIEQAHIVGHAAGGVAGLDFARQHPGRIASLTVVNGWLVADPHFVRCFEIRTALYDAGGPDAYLKAQPLFLFPASWISENLEGLDVQRAAHVLDFQEHATLLARIGALSSFDARDWAGQLQVPTLVVVSEDDMLVPPASGRLLAETLPHADLHTVEWGGHAVNITNAAKFDPLLASFLSKHRVK